MRLFLLCWLIAVVSSNVRVKRIIGGHDALPPQNISSAELAKVPGTSTPGTTSTTTESVDVRTSTDDSVVYFKVSRSIVTVNGLKVEDGCFAFKGIPYAEPPIDSRRLARPVFLNPSGKIDATVYGSACVQPDAANKKVLGKEDCLYLNIFTPGTLNNGKYPVLFWIHGGGFKRGSGNQYGVTTLVKKKIVVVTFNYRLGSFGFLGSTDQMLSGNPGLFDIRAALDWTKKYISYFGGDKNKIYVGGQGSGATVAVLLAQSSVASKYLAGVFAMSGVGVSSSGVDYNASSTYSYIAQTTRCSQSTTLKTIRCLQKLDVQTITTCDNELENNRTDDDGDYVSSISKLLVPGPIIEGEDDGRFLPYFLNEGPYEALKKTKVVSVPLMTGVTQLETKKSASGSTYVSKINSLVTDPNYLETKLPTILLNNNIGLFVNGTVNALLKALFSNASYLKLFSSFIYNGLSAFGKFIESTADALFHLPAVTTSYLWKKSGGDVYFYSFEHAPKIKVASGYFIEGVPLYTNEDVEKTTASHGDDLLYLFELQTLDGNLNADYTLTDADDLKVKDTFTSALVEFLYTGKPKVSGGNDWPTFTETDSQYVIISTNSSVESNFRKCKMAMWGGFVNSLKSCGIPGLDLILNSIPNLEQLVANNSLLQLNPVAKLSNVGNKLASGLTSIASGVTNPKGDGSVVSNLAGGVLGGGSKTASSSKDASTSSSTKTPASDIVGGLFGGAAKTTSSTKSTKKTSTTTARSLLGLPLG